MPEKTRASIFLYHNCQVWLAIFIRSLNISEKFKAGFDSILRNIQAAAREFVSYKKKYSRKEASAINLEN